jgi:glycosyltransferase involved in cell wall biosynthesis
LRVTIVAANTLEYDSRIRRMATALGADGHAVTVVAYAAPRLPPREWLGERALVTRIELDRRIGSSLRPLPGSVRAAILRAVGLVPDAIRPPPGPSRGLDRLRAPLRRGLDILASVRRTGPWTDAVVAAAPGADVVQAKALIALPVARAVARRLDGRRGRFVYDVADLHTESGRLVRLPRVVRSVLRARERRWIRDAVGTLAVTDAMAGEIQRRFRVARPITVLNCPPAWHPETPGPIESNRLAEALGLGQTAVDRPAIVLYQGAFRPDQGIEELVAAIDDPALTGVPIVAAYLGFGPLEAWLRSKAGARPDRIAVLPAVPDDELLEWTAGADISFVGAPPRTANQRLTLPNKLFQSLMAGVPIVVATGTEHCRIASTEGVGRCCDVDSPRSIATTLAELARLDGKERAALRARCRAVALERYSWETAQRGLIELYRELAEGRSST